MIQFQSKRVIGKGLEYHKYDSEYYGISIAYMDGKLFGADTSCKKSLFPNISIEIENDSCSISMSYDGIMIHDEEREGFLEGYNSAVRFIDEELKPFMDGIISGKATQ